MKPHLVRLAALILSGAATAKDFRGCEYDAVRDIKLSQERHVRAAVSEIVERAEDGGAGSRKITYVASSEHVDRMGDIIRVYGGKGSKSGKGWQLANFKANPVCLWGHDHDKPIALGAAWREKSYAFKDGTVGPALFVTFDYHTPDENPAAEVAFKLAKARKLRATSVGFKPLLTAEHKTEEDRVAAGLGPWGIEFVEEDLLETSLVAVPANPMAVELGLKGLVASGAITQRDAEVFAKTYPTTQEELSRRIAARLRSIVDLGRARVIDAEPAGESTVEIEERDAAEPVEQDPVDAEPVETPDEPPEQAPATPAKRGTVVTVTVTGVEAAEEALRSLLSDGAFRTAVRAALSDPEGLRDRASVELAFQPDPEEPAPDLAAEAAALSAAMPARARAAVSRALQSAFEQLEAASEVLGLVVDAVEGDVGEDEDVEAMLAASNAKANDGQRLLLEQLRAIIDRVKTTQDGGPRAPAPAAPRSPGNVDPAQAADLVQRIRNHTQAVAK